MSLKRPFVPKSDVKQRFTTTTTATLRIEFRLKFKPVHYSPGSNSTRARGVLFVLKGPYDPRVPPIVKFSQESESARLTKIVLSKSTVKTL